MHGHTMSLHVEAVKLGKKRGCLHHGSAPTHKQRFNVARLKLSAGKPKRPHR